MQTKHLCVLIHIWTKGEVGAPLNLFKPSSQIFYWPFQGGTFYVFFLSCVCYAFVCVCLYVPCGHLLGKGWPLGSRLKCLAVSLLLSHWYPGSGVVLDCIGSWSLHPYLLCNDKNAFLLPNNLGDIVIGNPNFSDQFSILHYPYIPHNLIKENLTGLIEQTFNREGSPFLACIEKRAFYTFEWFKLVSCQNFWRSPLSFRQYIYKIWLTIV